jgi:hypothetical protein
VRPLSRTITARQSATPLGTQKRPARHAELFALGTTDHRPHRLQKRETPGGKLKMMKAFPPGAISHPAARRETSLMLRRRKDGCQRNKFHINMCLALSSRQWPGIAPIGNWSVRSRHGFHYGRVHPRVIARFATIAQRTLIHHDRHAGAANTSRVGTCRRASPLSPRPNGPPPQRNEPP